MPKISERERIQALEAKLKQLKVVQQRKEARVGTETCGPRRRKPILGGCGKNVPVFHAPARKLAPPLVVRGRHSCQR